MPLRARTISSGPPLRCRYSDNSSIDLVERALLDENIDRALVLARASGCCWATAKSLLCLSAARRRLSVMDMDRAQTSFERLQIETARRAVEFYGSSRKPRIEAMMHTENPPRRTSPLDPRSRRLRGGTEQVKKI